LQSDMKKQTSLSAVIIAKNEEDLILGCLRSVSFCDEIVVVVDSATNDDTERIARSFTPNVHHRTFDNFASQKNYAISKATSTWVLVIDADERVTKELREEIRRTVSHTASWGFEIPTKPYVFGIEVKHSGWAPSYHLRLFRSDGRYEGEVHEVIPYKGKVGRLNNPLVHYNYFSPEHFVTKLNLYTNLEAVKLKQSGTRFRWPMLVVRPAREFLYRYLKQSGWRDGFIGFVIATLMAFYRFIAVLKLWYLQRGAETLSTYQELDRVLLQDK
jgi:glycosyltransferase involved in cell wall biosynthesis